MHPNRILITCSVLLTFVAQSFGQPTGEGACCYEDPDLGWTCVWTDEGECDNYFFGTWYSNTPCSQIDCESTEPDGACCYPDADLGWTCVYTDPWTCDDGPHCTLLRRRRSATTPEKRAGSSAGSLPHLLDSQRIYH